MESIYYSILQHDWIPFKTYKVSNAQILWANYSFFSDFYKSNITAENSNVITDDCAYLIKDTECFKTVTFDLNDYKYLTAERYGGYGIGNNGGGGRCGNDENFQLKGIGKNCMVGETQEFKHAYGAQDLPIAIAETIYTNLLNSIMPIGAVGIHAIILTGENTAFDYDTSETCPGVIIVREKCLRPAHLMRAPDFQISTQFKNQLADDTVRLRRFNKTLKKSIESDDSVILFWARLLGNCANQFAFSRAFRLTHGALSPSNISMDGSWIDVPRATFLNTGINYLQSSDFYSEHEKVRGFVTEILHEYAKYNNKSINAAPLLSYYDEQFTEYFSLHLGFVFGFDPAQENHLKSREWSGVVNAINKVIMSAKLVSLNKPQPTPRDTLIILIKALFLSLRDNKKTHSINGISLSDLEISTLFSDFAACTSLHSKSTQSINNEPIIKAAIKALRRAHISHCFYGPVVYQNVTKCLEHKDDNKISHLIDDHLEISRWFFHDSDKKIYIHKTLNNSIYLLDYKDGYAVNIESNPIKYFSDIKSAIRFYEKNSTITDSSKFLEIGFYLEDIIEVISSLTVTSGE